MSHIDQNPEKKFRVIGKRTNGDTVQLEDGITFDRARQVRAALAGTFAIILIEEVLTTAGPDPEAAHGSDTRSEI
jgi:hypothetical protein